MTTPARRSATASAGERKLVTMLFADLSGYTALAESLDPEEVYSFLRPTMLELQRVVESFGGSVPQIQGDGFMAVFGVPTAHEDDGERAVRAALAVRDHVQALNEGRAGLSFPQVHAGVNSGEVMVGPSEEASGYTVMGDTVNTASRMADLATAGHVLVDASTRTLTASSIRYGPRRMRKAKGKAEPIATFEALGPLARDPASARGGAFVDREEFFALFGRELEGTEADGCSRVVVLTGEPGIGKSRLAQELGSSLAPGRFLLGRCAPFGERRLSSLAEVVACALGVGTGTAVDATRAAIERVARRIARTHHLSVTPDLRSLLGVDDPSRSRRSDRDIMRATRLVIEDAARLGTVAVVLDDLQWADASIDELLADARRNPWPAPVLLLGLSREPIAGLAATPLPGLDVGSMRTLAESLLGEPGSADSVGVPLDRANGNALFLEEMVGMLVEHGAVRHDADGWRLTDPEAVHEVPASIRLVIAARLDGLPADQKRVLHDASVCGAVVWGSLLEQLSDVPDPRATLRELVRRELLRKRPRSSIPGTTEYEWKHALIRDVAYDSLPRAVRAQRHEQVAAWLRASAPAAREPVVAIAYHYERAWESSRGRTGPGPSAEITAQAAEYLTRVAEQVFVHQARAAERPFRRALRIIDASPRAVDPAVAARASIGLAEVLIEMGAHAEAIEQARRARKLAERAADGLLVARALLALGRSESDNGRMGRARTLLEDARERFEHEGDLRGQGWALHRLSETWGWEGFERELEDLRAAYRLFARARDRFGRSVVANDLAYILSVEGGREFHQWYAKASDLAEDEGDLRSRALLLRSWGNFCNSAGSFEEAARTMATGRPVAAEAGERYAEADALLVEAIATVNIGDPALAHSLAQEAVAIGRELGSVRIPAIARLGLARAEIRLGNPAASSRALRAARDAIHTHGLLVMGADLAEAVAMVALDRGAWSRAGAAADGLDEALRAIPMGLWESLPSLIRGRALLGAGAHAEAAASLEDALRRARRVGANGRSALAAAILAQARAFAGGSLDRSEDAVDPEVAAVREETAGIVAMVRGDRAGGIQAFDEAIERWSALGSTAWLARALAMRADALQAAGDRARAAAARGRSRAVIEQIGMPARDRASLEHPLAGLL